MTDTQKFQPIATLIGVCDRCRSTVTAILVSPDVLKCPACANTAQRHSFFWLWPMY
jgi:hypothetical protein